MEPSSFDPATQRLARLDDLSDLEIAPSDRDVRGWPVIDQQGRRVATVRHLIVDVDARRVRYVELSLADGDRAVYLPVTALRLDDAHGQLVLDALDAEDLATLPPARDGALQAREADEAGRLTLARETLDLQRRAIPIGDVLVDKHVETRHVREAVPVGREDVTIERRAATDDTPTEPHTDGDVIRIPIFEERLFVEKRLVPVEEIVIRRRVVTQERIVEAELKREVAEVRRVDAEGRRVEPDVRRGE